jgi:hypothetical protein
MVLLIIGPVEIMNIYFKIDCPCNEMSVYYYVKKREMNYSQIRLLLNNLPKVVFDQLFIKWPAYRKKSIYHEMFNKESCDLYLHSFNVK